jgi:hypothetical protein
MVDQPIERAVVDDCGGVGNQDDVIPLAHLMFEPLRRTEAKDALLALADDM